MWGARAFAALIFIGELLGLAAVTAFAQPLGRPGSVPGLRGVPPADILAAQAAAWRRDYNNFVDASDMCFDRAVDVIGELEEVETYRSPRAPLHLGTGWDLQHSNVAKMLLVFPYRYEVQATDGSSVPTTRWLYHIASAIRGTDGEWHPIDPDASGQSPATAEDWVARYAWDAWRRHLPVTRSAVGVYYQDLPPSGQVYFYWLPANYYQPGYDTGFQQLVTFFSRDPLSGRSTSVEALQSYRSRMLAQNPRLKLSGSDLEQWVLRRLGVYLPPSPGSAEAVSRIRMPGTPAAPRVR